MRTHSQIRKVGSADAGFCWVKQPCTAKSSFLLHIDRLWSRRGTAVAPAQYFPRRNKDHSTPSTTVSRTQERLRVKEEDDRSTPTPTHEWRPSFIPGTYASYNENKVQLDRSQRSHRRTNTIALTHATPRTACCGHTL